MSEGQLDDANSVATPAPVVHVVVPEVVTAVVPETAPEGAPAVPQGLPLGARLRHERETRGLSIDDVAANLKVGARRIDAIEAGRYESLLPLPYLRGFVRGYAKLLQIDVTPLLAEIDATIAVGQPAALPSDDRSLHMPFPQRSGHSSGSGMGRAMMIGAVVLAIIAALVAWSGTAMFADLMTRTRQMWTAVPDKATPATPAEEVHAPTPAAAVPAGTAVDVLPSPPAQDNAVQPGATALPAPQSSAAPLAKPDAVPAVVPAAAAVAAAPAVIAAVIAEAAPVRPAVAAPIVLRFKEQSWVEVRQADGKVLLSQINPPNTEKALDGNAPFELVIGNAAAVDLRYRGAPVDLMPYVRENVARLTLK